MNIQYNSDGQIYLLIKQSTRENHRPIKIHRHCISCK